MPEIIYTSLVKLPIKVSSIPQALECIYQYVDKPEQLEHIKSELFLIDERHINIVRYFDDVQSYQSWVFSPERNQADDILIQNGFYLYTRQARNDVIG